MKFFEGSVTERIGYDFYCDVANRLVEARKAKEWTRNQLAKASGLAESRIARLESVQTRFCLDDIETLSGALDVSVDWLIEAEHDSQVGECLYLVWLERSPDFSLYQKSTSKRLAFLQLHKRLRGVVRFMEPRDRAIVKLVGVPVAEQDLKSRFKNSITKDQDDILPDA